eukprot:1161718-Pelagomonas_calceolata.AAC.2
MRWTTGIWRFMERDECCGPQDEGESDPVAGGRAHTACNTYEKAEPGMLQMATASHIYPLHSSPPA